jgi:murein DD-endopeptidase MepM/ murein hydrolase activator NlpD
MKKWTVMLIPQDRGNSRTLTLTSLHFWLCVAVLAGFAFSTTLLVQWNRSIREYAGQLAAEKRQLEWQNGALPDQDTQVMAHQDASSQELKERLRLEYDAGMATITSELVDLYEMEAKVREITDLAPRDNRAAEQIIESHGGKGGPPDVLDVAVSYTMDETLRPPHVIYGVDRPSADLILQEIRMRTSSFRELVGAIEAEHDRIARIPAIWPVIGGGGRKTSTFGTRRDPIHGRLRHHNGLDIATKTGTRILSTARGVVVESTYDRWFGNLVKVNHGNGMHTLYAHMKKRLVEKGQTVERSTPVGTLGNTGRSTGPHLHYEVHIGKKAVNPQKYLTE